MLVRGGGRVANQLAAVEGESESVLSLSRPVAVCGYDVPPPPIGLTSTGYVKSHFLAFTGLRIRSSPPISPHLAIFCAHCDQVWQDM